jgi:hypothetical protein
MKPSARPALWPLLLAALWLGDAAIVGAESNPQITIEKRQAELERERIELEKKSVELQKRELALEQARQEFEAQQNGRSLSMNLSGDLLFDDSKGTQARNLDLSRERAQAVKNWLVKNGIAEANIATKGFGEGYPVAPNTNDNGGDNPIGRALNRRVSIIVENPAVAATR